MSVNVSLLDQGVDRYLGMDQQSSQTDTKV
jgi:hypothetical protein